MKEDEAIKYAQQCGQMGAALSFITMMLDTERALTKSEQEMLYRQASEAYAKYKEAFDEK